MGLSYLQLLVDQADQIYRLPVAKFERMLKSPGKELLPQFSGQRVRAIGICVRVVGRKPVEVVHMSSHVLSFDRLSRFDAEGFRRQEFSRAEVALSPALVALTPQAPIHPEVVDAEARFRARGGSWVPSRALARMIEDAALGRTKCPRI